MNDDPKKQISFPIYDLETDKIEELTMDEDTYNDMVECENQYQKERKELRKHLRQEEHYALLFTRD